jgi:diguanylate cyclase (GGDEF)-like protein
MRDMVPDHEEHWFEIYGKVARTGEEVRFENPATAMGKYYDVFAFRIGGPGSRKVGISFKDISERKEAERQLIATARYDALTGLPNRAMFHEHLARALPRVERERTTLALMFFDLDGFKAVNDSHGHQAGDRVLQVVAERLLACMRAGDMVARLGGDEFIILVENCPSDHLPEVAEKVLQAVAVPIEVDAGKVRVSASLGLSSYPDCAIDAEMLIHLADTAMYEAKRVGGGIYRASPPAPAGEAGQMAHPASASGG